MRAYKTLLMYNNWSHKKAKAMIKNEVGAKSKAMKRSIKLTRKRRPKRELFAELAQGLAALADAQHGQRTLRTHRIEWKHVQVAHVSFV